MIQQSQLEKSVERAVRVAAENAIEVDASGTFPRRAIDALASEGLLGLDCDGHDDALRRSGSC